MSLEQRISLQTIASTVDWLKLVSIWFIVFINTLLFKQVTSCSMHSIVTTFRGANIKVKVANFCAAMDTFIDQDAAGSTFAGMPCYLVSLTPNIVNINELVEGAQLSQITVLRYGVALVNECGLKQWYIMY